MATKSPASLSTAGLHGLGGAMNLVAAYAYQTCAKALFGLEFLDQQRIHPLHIRRRIGRQATFGQQCLVKQDVGQVIEVD